ncbi:MAG: PHB depolymerase family esterase [Acidisphaera sp.]|nr:PHB depolymerase family esterase [Acidisphaera sp.]
MHLATRLKLGRRALRHAWRSAAAFGTGRRASAPVAVDASGALIEVPGFGSNPGRLRMLLYAPVHAPTAGAPLIVVLHGCGQSAAEFARDAGWMALAERLGVPLLLPEQRGDNNRGVCFNWFSPGDNRRSRGEALSIRQMVIEAKRRFRSNPHRIFVAGLSAGGAMAAALLAAYPEVFAGGAVVAALPVGCASTASQALTRMADGGHAPPPGDWADQARAVGPASYAGPWPRLSIWHGMRDRTVDPGNAENLVAQWTALHGLPASAYHNSAEPGAHRRSWGDSDNPAVECWSIEGLAHGFPIAGESGGHPSTWVQDVGVDAPAAIARFWGLERPARALPASLEETLVPCIPPG